LLSKLLLLQRFDVAMSVPSLPLIMAALLSVCTKEEQRSVIQFLLSEVYQETKSIYNFQHNMETVY
jgi:hypothetical protein